MVWLKQWFCLLCEAEWSREEGSNGREIRSLCYESSSHVGFLFFVLNNWCQTTPSWFLNFFHCLCFSLTTHLSHCSQNGSSIPRFCVLFSSLLFFFFLCCMFLWFHEFPHLGFVGIWLLLCVLFGILNLKWLLTRRMFISLCGVGCRVWKLLLLVIWHEMRWDVHVYEFSISKWVLEEKVKNFWDSLCIYLDKRHVGYIVKRFLTPFISCWSLMSLKYWILMSNCFPHFGVLCSL